MRETDQEQRDRKDSEMQQVRRARQERLGHVVPDSEEVEAEEETEAKPKAKNSRSSPSKTE